MEAVFQQFPVELAGVFLLVQRGFGRKARVLKLSRVPTRGIDEGSEGRAKPALAWSGHEPESDPSGTLKPEGLPRTFRRLEGDRKGDGCTGGHQHQAPRREAGEPQVPAIVKAWVEQFVVEVDLRDFGCRAWFNAAIGGRSQVAFQQVAQQVLADWVGGVNHNRQGRAGILV